MSRETKIKVAVVIVVGILLCGVGSINKNTDIANGYVGDQKVYVIKFFNYLVTYDEEGNRRYYINVRDFDFMDDELVINREGEEKPEIISRVGEIITIDGYATAIAVLDYSELTIFYLDGGKSSYYGVKEIGNRNDERGRLWILYYDNTLDWIE